MSQTKAQLISDLVQALAFTATASAPTNGMFLSATNELAISTNSTQRLTVDSSGNVGIGTTSPSYLLDVYTQSNDIAQFSGINGGSLLVRNASSNIVSLNAQSGDSLAFGTNGNTERLRINSTGLVGIANTNPQTLLSLLGNYQIGWNHATDGTKYAEIYADTSSNLIFRNTNSQTERMRIDSSGNVLINTTTLPTSDSKLTVQNSGSSCEINVISGASGGSVVNMGDTDDYNDGRIKYDNSSRSMQFQTANAERLRIDANGTAKFTGGDAPAGLDTRITRYGSLLVGTDSDTVSDARCSIDSGNGNITTTGNVGIGTTSPQRALVVSDNGAEGFEFFPGSSDTANTLNHYDRASSSFIDIISQADKHIFGRADGEKMRIDSSGNVLINTTTLPTSDSKLTVQNSGSACEFNVISGTSSGSVVNMGDTDDYNDGRIKYDNSSRSMEFQTANAERLKIDSSGNLDLGNNDGSASNQGFYLQPNGAGYVFTSSALNAINIYQSGTKNVEINSSGNVKFGAFNSSSNSGYGAKIDITANAGRIFSQIQSTGSSLTDMVAVYMGSTKTFQVLASGNVQNTNNSYGAISDVKLKENIVDANSQWDDIKDLRVRNYNFIEGQTHTQIGVVAQEVETVSPGLVTESPDLDAEGNDLGTTTKSVNYSVLYMKAVKALQEAMDRIETLEAKVAALEAE